MSRTSLALCALALFSLAPAAPADAASVPGGPHTGASAPSSGPSLPALCVGERVWFDDACRTESWFSTNLSRSGYTLLLVMGAKNNNLFGGDEDGVILVEQADAGTLVYTFIEGETSATGGMTALTGPTRRGYPIRGVYTEEYSFDSDDNLVLYTETKVPVSTFSVGYGSSGALWAWEVLDWQQRTWFGSSSWEECNEDGCARAYAYTGEWACDHLYEAAYAKAANDCAVGLGTAAATIGGLGAVIAIGATGGLAVLATPAALGVAGAYITGSGGVIAYLCDNSATQQAVSELLENGCIEDDPPTDGPGGDLPGGGHLPGGDDGPAEPLGCTECTEWDTETYDTSDWDESTGTLTIYSHEEVVCTEWSIDPTGADTNDDGWCD